MLIPVFCASEWVIKFNGLFFFVSELQQPLLF